MNLRATGKPQAEPKEEASAQALARVSRRQVLAGAAGAAGLLTAGAGRAGAQMGTEREPAQGQGQAAATAPAGFDPAYVQHVIARFERTSFYQAETPPLPMIGPAFSKQFALPYDLWGLLYDDWAPCFEKDGLSVFILGLDKRGPDNRRKRIYISALTGDLYPMYADKVRGFFGALFSPQNAGKPLMRLYLDSYFDLFWDLHLGVKGDAIPAHVRQIGESFNALGFRDPSLEIVYENYMKVRALRTPLKQWIDEKLKAVMDGRIKDPEKTFVYYWTKNGEGKARISGTKDIVFKCFHNFWPSASGAPPSTISC